MARNEMRRGNEPGREAKQEIMGRSVG